jgi:hypothetical protein
MVMAIIENRARHLRGETSDIMSRLLSSLPAATLEMETLAKLAGIVSSRKVPTAAMECKHRPRLLLNPDFIGKFCQRDEHIMLLVMHELWHVMMAHTSLYPRVTQAQNIAFDAIINSSLMRRFHTPEYFGFFDKLNPSDKFPHMLLRPPVGWPDNPQYPDNVGPPGTKRILQQLYPEKQFLRYSRQVTFYHEILSLIREDMRQRGINPDGIPVLIGDHDELDDDSKALMGELIGDAIGDFRLLPSGFNQRGRGGYQNSYNSDVWESSYDARRIFSSILKKAIGPESGRFQRRTRTPIQETSGTGVIPNPRDRMIHARRLLGSTDSLWNQRYEVNARIKQPRRRAYVYFDVSGSMGRVIPYLLGLLTPYVVNDQAKLFQFSTIVEPLPLKALNKGLVTTTGGTSIVPVFDHLIQQTQMISRVLILTDGITGSPTAEQIAVLQARKTKVHVVLPFESANTRDLESVATSMTILPRLS